MYRPRIRQKGMSPSATSMMSATALLSLLLCTAGPAHAQAPPADVPATTAETADHSASEPAAEPAAPAAQRATEPAAKGPTYDTKLRELEEKVVNLKEKIFRTKTRLLLLKERVLNDVIAEAKAEIVHVNDMGSSFKPVRVMYELDGEKIYFADEKSGALDAEKLDIFEGNVLAGNHVLAVEMVYRGDSPVFTYLNDYVFKLRASYTFYATKGKVTTVRSIGFQKGDFTDSLTERPSIKFEVSQVSYVKDDTEASGKAE